MTEPDFTIGAGDLRPVLEVTLIDAAGDPIVADSVTFTMRRIAVDRVVAVDAAAATEVNAATGIWRYEWVDGDTDTPGLYRGAFSATVAGKPVRFPNTDEALTILVTRAVGG